MRVIETMIDNVQILVHNWNIEGLLNTCEAQ